MYFYLGAAVGFVVGILVVAFAIRLGSSRLPDAHGIVLSEGKVKKGGVNEPPTTPKPPGAPKAQRPQVRWLREGDPRPRE